MAFLWQNVINFLLRRMENVVGTINLNTNLHVTVIFMKYSSFCVSRENALNNLYLLIAMKH